MMYRIVRQHNQVIVYQRVPASRRKLTAGDITWASAYVLQTGYYAVCLGPDLHDASRDIDEEVSIK